MTRSGTRLYGRAAGAGIGTLTALLLVLSGTGAALAACCGTASVSAQPTRQAAPRAEARLAVGTHGATATRQDLPAGAENGVEKAGSAPCRPDPPTPHRYYYGHPASAKPLGRRRLWY
ncbi:MAG TPA: hypothetical protein VEJ84_20730 [Acidimicrobiales bacterium]|nr:hypothetical protein [Acidimicrobiales bacterium]